MADASSNHCLIDRFERSDNLTRGIVNLIDLNGGSRVSRTGHPLQTVDTPGFLAVQTLLNVFDAVISFSHR